MEPVVIEPSDQHVRIVLDHRHSLTKQIQAAMPADTSNPLFQEQAVRIVRQTAALGLSSVRIRYPNNERRYAVSLVHKHR